METTHHLRNSVPQDPFLETPELADVARQLKQAYPAVEPSLQFRQALHARLMAEAQRFKELPAVEPRVSHLRKAVVGAAALSVAALALVVWRSRLGSTLLSQGQLRTAEGS